MIPYLPLTSSAFGAQALMFVPILPLVIGTGALAARGQMQPLWALAALGAGVAAGDCSPSCSAGLSCPWRIGC